MPVDDLLSATLDERHDLQGFRRPWNPDTLVFLSFFIGAWAGGWLVAENFRRLGLKQRFMPFLAAFIAIGSASVGLALWMMHGKGELFYEENKIYSRLGHRILTVALALLAAYYQRNRWRIFDASGKRRGELWTAALAAFAVAISFRFVIFFAADYLSHD